jgi:large subunit ribosomal protein L20
MPRVKRGVTARARHKKVLALAKGYRGRRKNVFRIAKQAVMRAGQYAYRDRRTKKRVFRHLWIARINAGSRSHGVTYSKFMAGLKKLSIEIVHAGQKDKRPPTGDGLERLDATGRRACRWRGIKPAEPSPCRRCC